MVETSSFSSTIARRYGGALFELAQAENCIDEIGQTLTRFIKQVDINSDLQRLILSPLFSIKDQLRVISVLMEKIMSPADTGKVFELVGNFLKTVATNRRLAQIRSMIEVFYQLRAHARGELVANVTSAHILTLEQQQQLKAELDKSSGKNVTLQVKINPDLLGGLVVQLGSRQLDTSLRSKLSSLKMYLKEVD